MNTPIKRFVLAFALTPWLPTLPLAVVMTLFSFDMVKTSDLSFFVTAWTGGVTFGYGVLLVLGLPLIHWLKTRERLTGLNLCIWMTMLCVLLFTLLLLWMSKVDLTAWLLIPMAAMAIISFLAGLTFSLLAGLPFRRRQGAGSSGTLASGKKAGVD